MLFRGSWCHESVVSNQSAVLAGVAAFIAGSTASFAGFRCRYLMQLSILEARDLMRSPIVAFENCIMSVETLPIASTNFLVF